MRRTRRRIALLTAVLCASGFVVDAAADDRYGTLPLVFEANRGQTDPRVRFLARGSGLELFLTADEAVYRIRSNERAAVLRLRLIGANASPRAVGSDRLSGESHYLSAADPDRWVTHVPQYRRVEMRDVYPGIDLAYYGNGSNLEYDFVVAPHASPRAIDFEIDGAISVDVNGAGALVIGTAAGDVVWRAPAMYQEVGSERRPVRGGYVRRGARRIGFRVEDYDRRRPLVIDPILVYWKTVGGSGIDHAAAIAVDATGRAVITGDASSADFPTTAGAYNTTRTGTAREVFVSQLTADGTDLVYSTFLGLGHGAGVALHNGHAYVTGSAEGSFPTTAGAYVDSTAGENAFVTELTADGSGLVYSALFGGGATVGAGIAVDAAGNAYVTGQTTAANFPTTTNALQPTRPSLGQVYLGDIDAFLVKLNPSGSALDYATYLGSDVNDTGSGVAVDPNGFVYVVGTTYARAVEWNGFPAETKPFPTTAGAYKTTFYGPTNAFVSKFDLSASGAASLVYSTFVGGDNVVDGVFIPGEQGNGIAVDAIGSAYLTGVASVDFPATAGAYGGSSSGGAFVAKLDPGGSSLLYNAIIGGTWGAAIALDSSSRALVAGIITSEPDFVAVDPLPTVSGGSVFLARINAAGSGADYAIYLDGHSDVGIGVAVDPFDAVYVAGTAFPAPGNTDGFVAKVVTNRAPVASAGPDQHVFLGASFTLDATASSDPDGDSMTYAWTEGSTPIDSGATVQVSGASQGVHTYTVTVSDGALTSSDDVTVSVEAGLIVNIFGAATGRVTSDDGQIDCVRGGASCLGRYAASSVVNFTAIPDAGAVFSGWSFDCGGTGSCAVTTNALRIVGALFDVQQLTLTAAPGANGRITSAAPNLNCASSCSVSLSYGDAIALTAVPDGGYLFDAWTGACAGTIGAVCSLTVTANMSAGATFNAVTLDSLAVSPAAATIAVGGQQLFRAIGTFSDGSSRPLSSDHSLEATDDSTCAIKTNGNVTCWNAQSPFARPVFQNASALSAGTSKFCALFADGTVACDGSGPVPGITTAVAIASESQYACALLADHTVECWQMGTTAPLTTVPGINNAVAIGAEGGADACAVLADGTVSCWTFQGSAGGFAVSGVDHAVSVVVGAAHKCALIADGTVRCWGDNTYGQLGDGSITDAIGIISGDYHACVLLATHDVKCWGMQYANGGNADSSIPITIGGLVHNGSGPVAIAAGAWHNCASFADGAVMCFGLNNIHQLGQSNPPVVLTPFTVAGVNDVATLGWSSVGPVARTISSGLAIATSPGSAVVRADAGSLVATANLTVVNTPAGANVDVQPVDQTSGGSPVDVTFAAVAQAGSTTLTTSTSGFAPPAGFEVGNPPLYFDLSTTASYTPPVTICASYAGVTFSSQPQLFHFESGAWVDVTTSVDTVQRIVCGRVTSLSPFAIFQRTPAPACTAAATASPNALWPPNHKMVRVTIAVAPGASCAAPVTCAIESVASNEPVNGTGDGDTAPDWTIVGARLLDLRAERAGGGSGRVYTVSLRCAAPGSVDFTTTATVSVPHQR